MRHITIASASAIALLAACSTAGPNTGQSPVPGDSTFALRTDSTTRDSLGGRNTSDSANAAVRRTRDSILAATRRTADTVANATRSTADSIGASARTTVDSIGGNMRATVPVKSSDGRDLGTLNITDAAQALSISGTLRGLPPGTLGVHLHMVGRCDAPAFEGAGGHWNPTNKQHGSENQQGPHLGDMNNITVGSDSTARILVVTRGGSLRGTNMLMDADGAALVVHTAADDYRTDPSGNTGARIACGVISGNR